MFILVKSFGNWCSTKLDEWATRKPPHVDDIVHRPLFRDHDPDAWILQPSSTALKFGCWLVIVFFGSLIVVYQIINHGIWYH